METRFTSNVAEVAAAQACLDALLKAFNRRDIAAWEGTFNFPHVLFVAGAFLTVPEPGQQAADFFTSGALSEWDHSEWGRRDVLHASASKVHIDVRFDRYRKDGSLLGGFDAIFIVTQVDGHWGVQGRSINPA